MTAPQRQGRRRVLKRVLGPALGLLLLGGALWVVRGELGEHSLREVLATLRSLPLSRVALSLLATVIGYAALSGQDLLALHWLGARLPARKALLAGFEGFAFANTLPLAVVAGGAVRARFYAGSKLSKAEIADLVLFNTATYALGLLAATGIAFTLEPAAIPGLLGLPVHSTRPLGLVALALLGLFLWWSARGGPTLRVGKRTLRPTPIGMSLARLGVSLLDWVFSGLALYLLLPHADAYHFMGFLGVFMLGQIAGLLAQLPGGIGVFEAVMLRVLGRSSGVAAVLAALLVYRVVYFLLPLIVATVILAGHEIGRMRSRSRT
ncbi:MAG TPA: lysylphosphatidylglycerol synthase domain-containing protein [Gemmatimonadales bacterium]